MKIVICALLVAFAYAGTILPLSGLTTAPVNPAYTLTATYPVATPNVAVTAFSGISTYTASATPAAIGAVSLTVTWVNVNQTIGVAATYGTGINANTVLFTGQSSTTTAGVTTTVYTNTGSTQSFRFDAAGTYTVVVSATSSVGYTFANLALPGSATGTSLVVTGSYTAPTLASFTMITPNGCTSTGCTAAPNATATIAPVLNNWSLTALFRATGATQAGVFYTSASCDATSTCNYDSIFATAWAGSFGGFTAYGYGAASTLTAGNTLVPQGGSAAGSALISDSRNFYGTYINEATFATKQAAITFPVGSTDVTAPTCTSAIFTPAAGTTIDTTVSTDLAIVCADAGAGLFRKGAFATATTTGASSGIPATTFAYNQAGSATSVTTAFPPYVSGTLQIVGVWAVDNALNSALYGSCGNFAGYTTIGCTGGSGGSGSSSASTVSLSLFALFSLVVMALFA